MNGVLDRIAGKERQEVLSEPENFAEHNDGLLKAALSACLLQYYFWI